MRILLYIFLNCIVPMLIVMRWRERETRNRSLKSAIGQLLKLHSSFHHAIFFCGYWTFEHGYSRNQVSRYSGAYILQMVRDLIVDLRIFSRQISSEGWIPNSKPTTSHQCQVLSKISQTVYALSNLWWAINLLQTSPRSFYIDHLNSGNHGYCHHNIIAQNDGS